MYDETNVVDDRGATSNLTKRGTKYSEQIRNTTKASTSLTVAGNAAGEIIPVYVVYKSEKLWQTWTENGPENERSNRIKSGWFDYQCFEDWFLNIIIKKDDKKTVLIGEKISFITLPLNATYLPYPLDVAFLKPMKGNWRTILHEWKERIS